MRPEERTTTQTPTRQLTMAASKGAKQRPASDAEGNQSNNNSSDGQQQAGPPETTSSSTTISMAAQKLVAGHFRPLPVVFTADSK